MAQPRGATGHLPPPRAFGKLKKENVHRAGARFREALRQNIFKITTFEKIVANLIKMQIKWNYKSRMGQLLIELNFPTFSACKIIENVIKIERNVTFRTRYWTTTGNRIACCIISSGSREEPGNLPVTPENKFLELKEW